MGVHYLVYGAGCEKDVDGLLQNAPEGATLQPVGLESFLKEHRATEEDRAIIYG
jgi:hypothetical protein